MDLKVNYEATRATGNQVSNYSQEFNTLLGEIKELNESLKSSWQGADAESYTNEITEQAQVMDKLKSSLEEIGQYLVKVGNAYEKAMEENKIN